MEHRIRVGIGLLATLTILLLFFVTALRQSASLASPAAAFSEPTSSSPIALSADKAWVWSVNPDDDSVSVINTGADTEVFRLVVGDEPQSVALDPNNQYAYVANAAENSLTVIRITGTNPFGAVVESTVTTGAEPWNVVISPNGKRVYVANSGQDTITVIKADVTFPTLPTIIGNVDLGNSACNIGDANRHFQPRGLAVTLNNDQLYVTRFLSFTRSGGVQAANDGKQGVVCRLDIDTSAATVAGSVTGYTPITLAAQPSGFGSESAYPNQLQSVVIRGSRAFLPNIAAAPAAPLRFNNDTHAFVSIIDGVGSPTQSDGGALNLHLGARVAEAGKPRLFFANPWAIAFTTQSGAGNAYAVSAGSDLLVKLNVDAGGVLTFTNTISTTRTIDLNDPNNPTTSGRDAGKNPLGLVIRDTGVPSQRKAYVMNYVSRNVSVVNLSSDSVSKVINLTDLPLPGTPDEQLLVGKEVFFASRGNFDRPAGTTVSTVNRLSSEGWQNCASCHFAGLTDGNIWAFGAGPRKSVAMNGTFSPHNPDDQRLLNYSAIFDEVQDFELNIRNVSGPGPLSAGPPPVLDPNHGLLIGDAGDINTAPAVVNAFAKANSGRPQLSVTLPGSTTSWPALDALNEWVRFGIRTPNGALTTSELLAGGGSAEAGLSSFDVATGRRIFFQAGCQWCHGGTKWTVSNRGFTPPPAASEIATENPPTAAAVTAQYFARFLHEVGSFNLNVPGGGNLIAGTPAIGGVEKAADGKDALGKDYDGNGKGAGYNIPSLLGTWAQQPYYHNGACETLACVLSDVTHRTANHERPDVLGSATSRVRLAEFLKTLDDQTLFPTNLLVNRHDIFLDPPVVYQGATVTVGVNASLFGAPVDLDPISNTLKVRFIAPDLNAEAPLPAFTQDFGQATATTTWTVPNQPGLAVITVQVDSGDALTEAQEGDNTARRLVRILSLRPDAIPPTVATNGVKISDDDPFDENDPIAVTANVKVRIIGSDNAGGSGLESYCIVNYTYDVVLRRWVERSCGFKPLPAPDAINGDQRMYTVNASIPAREGVAYAFVWVKDAAGNISRTPGFDVISYFPGPTTVISLNRNDVRLFRLTLTPGQQITVDFTVLYGDVDVSVFDSVFSNANRIALSANNGASPESVTFENTTAAVRTFQMEAWAVVNSRFRMAFELSQALRTVLAPEELSPDVLTISPTSGSDLNSGGMLISGPPALQTGIDDVFPIYLPALLR